METISLLPDTLGWSWFAILLVVIGSGVWLGHRQ
jgi:hypothetical protein